MAKRLVSWDDVALALPAVVWTKLLATFDALGAAAAITPASIGAATPASVTAAVTALVNAAPGTMDTLGEIATIIASDESAAAALLTSVAAKATTVALTAETTRATAAEGTNAAAIAANTTAVTTEATTARNASNLTTGTVADARLPSTAQAATLSATFARGVSVKAFGATGDGTTDDTAAIQAALNAGSNTVYLPTGTYKVSVTLNIPSETHLIGFGRGSILTWAGAANGYMIRTTDTLDTSLERLELVCNSLANGIALTYSSGTNQGFVGYSLSIINPRIGFAVNPEGVALAPQVDNWTLREVHMGGSDNNTTMLQGVWINSDNSTGVMDKCRIYGVAALGTSIDITRSLYVDIAHCTFAGQNAIDSQSGIRVSGTGPGQINLNSCQAEKVGYFLHRSSTSLGDYTPIYLTGCVINDPIRFEKRGRLVTSGCQFYASMGTVQPIIIFNDSRNLWTDLGSHFGAAANFAAYFSFLGTFDVVTLIGTSMDGTTALVVPARFTYLGLETTTIRGALVVNGNPVLPVILSTTAPADHAAVWLDIT